MKPRFFLLTALLAIPAASLAAEPPVRIALRVPKAQLEPGKVSRIAVELLGERGRPAAAAEPLPIQLAGAAGLGVPARVTVPAGASRIEVPIRAVKPGLWKIEASSKGLFSGFGVVVCIAKIQRAVPISLPSSPPRAERPAHTAEPKSAAPELRHRFTFRRLPEGAIARPAPTPAPPPPSPGTAEVLRAPAHVEALEPSVQPGAETAPPPQGRVELIAQPVKVPRTRDGWKSLVDAFWFEGDVPALRTEPLNDVTLVIEGGSSVVASSRSLTIPVGQFKSQTSAEISAQSADTATVKALYPHGKSNPIEIDFLSPAPAQLALAGASRSFRGLTGVNSDILVRLLDDNGQPAVADQEIPVEVAVEGPLGTHSYPAKVLAGAIQTTVSLDLNRPGSYTVQASGGRLRPSDPVEVRFALDWLLILSSLVGGVLGSLTRVLYRRERVWPKGFVRTVALGVAAALFVLLLSVFGVLSVLGDALPAAQALEKVPATSLLGALLLGFIAGLVFDKIFARFLGARGRKAKPPGGAPAPKEAPA